MLCLPCCCGPQHGGEGAGAWLSVSQHVTCPPRCCTGKKNRIAYPRATVQPSPPSWDQPREFPALTTPRTCQGISSSELCDSPASQRLLFCWERLAAWSPWGWLAGCQLYHALPKPRRFWLSSGFIAAKLLIACNCSFLSPAAFLCHIWLCRPTRPAATSGFRSCCLCLFVHSAAVSNVGNH